MRFGEDVNVTHLNVSYLDSTDTPLPDSAPCIIRDMPPLTVENYSVQIYYVHAFLHCLPAGIECPTIRFAVIKGYHAI